MLISSFGVLTFTKLCIPIIRKMILIFFFKFMSGLVFKADNGSVEKKYVGQL